MIASEGSVCATAHLAIPRNTIINILSTLKAKCALVQCSCWMRVNEGTHTAQNAFRRPLLLQLAHRVFIGVVTIDQDGFCFECTLIGTYALGMLATEQIFFEGKDFPTSKLVAYWRFHVCAHLLAWGAVADTLQQIHVLCHITFALLVFAIQFVNSFPFMCATSFVVYLQMMPTNALLDLAAMNSLLVTVETLASRDCTGFSDMVWLDTFRV